MTSQTGTGKGLVANLGTTEAAGSKYKISLCDINCSIFDVLTAYIGTFKIKNFSGAPDITSLIPATSNLSSFQINTGVDFLKRDLFLIGLAMHDNKGRLVPTAVVSLEGPVNSQYNALTLV